jgi:ElaB/YqjD/DUF883 family membrane-anchored ribosome-binding protein
MGAPIRTSSDIPDFSTYPSAPSDHLLSAHASTKTPVEALPSEAENATAARLHDVATQIGSSVGAGVNAVRNARERAMERIQSLRGSLDDLSSSVRGRSTDLAQNKFDELRAQSQVQLRRAKQYADEKPLAVIAAAGVAGLVLGIGARTWRNNRG